MPRLFSDAEYPDMIYVYGFCDGSAAAAVDEYPRRYPRRVVPSRKVFYKIFNNLGENGTLPSSNFSSERQPVHRAGNENNILQIRQGSPTTSTRRISTQLNIPQTTVWRTLNAHGMRPFHVQKVQHHQPNDHVRRLQFCNWVNNNHHIIPFILFSDEATFNRNGINNTRNSHLWAEENPQAVVESNFQQRFSVHVWCDKLVNLLVLEPHLVCGKVQNAVFYILKAITEFDLKPPDVIVPLRINLPALPILMASTKNPNKSGLFWLKGILIAMTTPSKYLKSAVYRCPVQGCENDISERLYGEYFTDHDLKCKVCETKRMQIQSAQELGDQVIGVIIDDDVTQLGIFKWSQGTTVVFRNDLCGNLVLGATYHVTVCYDSGRLMAWGLFQQTPGPQIRLELGIPSEPIPDSIQNVIKFLRVKCPQSPWALTTYLSSQLALHLSPSNCFLHLKAGLLLSLASQGIKGRPVHLLSVGSEGRSILNYCSRFSKKVVASSLWQSNNPAGVSWLDIELNSAFLEAGPLIMANNGICFLGELTKVGNSQSPINSQIKHALEYNEVRLELQGSQNLGPNSTLPCYPLQCSIWAEYHEKPAVNKKNENAIFRSIIDLFGMPFISSIVSHDDLEDYVKHRMSIELGRNQTEQVLYIPEDDLKKYLDIVSSYPVSLSQKASHLLKRYFVASRRARPGCLPLSSVKIMTVLSEAHARISMHKEVTEDDVMFVIYLYEQSLNFVYGPSITCDLNLKRITASSDRSVSEQVDANIINFSVWLESSLKSLIHDSSLINLFPEGEE